MSTEIDIEAVRAELQGTRFADVRFVAETGSTNADLLEEARSGAAEGVVLTADHQRAGRGRLDRRWEAPPGSSLLVSVLTRPARPPLGLAPDELHLVTTAVGVAAAEAVREVAGAEVGLKWPNDLVATTGDEIRKLGGILAESVLVGEQVDALVVGLGLNVAWPDELTPDLAGVAVALSHLVAEPPPRQVLLVALLRRLDRHYGGLGTLEGRAALLTRYRALSWTLGRRVRVHTAEGTIVGDAVDVTSEGHLLVVDDCPDQPREITVGDVVQLRPGE